jgi:hypothetical protein
MISGIGMPRFEFLAALLWSGRIGRWWMDGGTGGTEVDA